MSFFFSDDGTCKHCVALLFALSSFCERHRDRGTESCTDKGCSWDKPRKVSHPVVVQNLSYSLKPDHCDLKDKFIPVSNENTCSEDENNNINIKSLYKACKKFGSVFVHTIDPLSDTSDSEDGDDVDKQFEDLSCLWDIIADYKNANDSVQNEDILNHIQGIFNPQLIAKIEETTRDQTDSDLWFDLRKGRITASVMSSVLKCRIDRLEQTNYITKRINGEANFISTAATDYGQTMEVAALQQYSENYKKNHSKATIDKSGLIISATYPFIAASPDGVVSCKCCGEGLIEIKCSFTHQDKYISEISNYHITYQDGEMKLNKKSAWYAQVQTQLYCSGRHWCDFVLFTRKDIGVDRITFDEQYFNECLEKSCQFFFRFLI